MRTICTAARQEVARQRLASISRERSLFIMTYNVVLLGILLIFFAWYWGEKAAWAWRERSSAIRASKEDAKHLVLEDVGDDINGEISSSSSSTLEGTATPPDAAKVIDDDDERKPLLPHRKHDRRVPQGPIMQFRHG